MFSIKLVVFSLFLIGASCTSVLSNKNRHRRTLEDVFALVKQDEIWPLLLCDMCTETLKCARDYCRICSDCMNQQAMSGRFF